MQDKQLSVNSVGVHWEFQAGKAALDMDGMFAFICRWCPPWGKQSWLRSHQEKLM